MSDIIDEQSLLEGLAALLDNDLDDLDLDASVEYLRIQNYDQPLDSTTIISPGMFDDKPTTPPEPFTPISKLEWDSRFKHWSNICKVMKNAEMVENYYDTLTEKSKFFEDKLWLTLIRENFDRLENYQREQFLMLIKPSWIFLKPPPKDPLPQIASAKTDKKKPTKDHKVRIEPSSDLSSAESSSTPSEEDEWRPPKKPAARIVGQKRKLAVVKPKRQVKANRKAAAVKRKQTMERKKAVEEEVDNQWYHHLALLLRYKDLKGDINVPEGEVVHEDGVTYNLGQWLTTQRSLLGYFQTYEFEKYDVLLSLNETSGLLLELPDEQFVVPAVVPQQGPSRNLFVSQDLSHGNNAKAPVHGKPFREVVQVQESRKARSAKMPITYESGSDQDDDNSDDEAASVSIAPKKTTPVSRGFVNLKSTKSQAPSKKHYVTKHASRKFHVDDSVSEESVILSEDDSSDDDGGMSAEPKSSARSTDAEDL